MLDFERETGVLSRLGMKCAAAFALLLGAQASEDVEAPVISLNVAQLTQSEVREAYKERAKCDAQSECSAGESCLRPKFKNGVEKGVSSCVRNAAIAKAHILVTCYYAC